MVMLGIALGAVLWTAILLAMMALNNTATGVWNLPFQVL
jgi:hypothetical protein